MVNARFWAWHNGGWVKLTLAPGQELGICSCGRTDEGWRREMTQYRHDGSCVVAEYIEESSDCDGRLDRGGEMYCTVDGLRKRDMADVNPCPENAGIVAPDWQRGPRWQRDHVAEACGY